MFSASLVQLGTTRNYIAVEEKFLGFVLVYELACTELHGSGSFVTVSYTHLTLPTKRIV